MYSIFLSVAPFLYDVKFLFLPPSCRSTKNSSGKKIFKNCGNESGHPKIQCNLTSCYTYCNTCVIQYVYVYIFHCVPQSFQSWCRLFHLLFHSVLTSFFHVVLVSRLLFMPLYTKVLFFFLYTLFSFSFSTLVLSSSILYISVASVI